MQLTYNLTQATELLGIHADTLKNYEKQGRITPCRTEGGHRRYTIKQLYQLVKARIYIPIVPLIIQIKERNYRNFEELFEAFEQAELMEENIKAIQWAEQDFSHHHFISSTPTISIPEIPKNLTKDARRKEEAPDMNGVYTIGPDSPMSSTFIEPFSEEIKQHITQIMENRLKKHPGWSTHISINTRRIGFRTKFSMPDKPIHISTLHPADEYVQVCWQLGIANDPPDSICMDYINCEDFSKDVLYEHLSYPYCLKGIA